METIPGTVRNYKGLLVKKQGMAGNNKSTRMRPDFVGTICFAYAL